jgi:heme exporter protein C
MHARSGSLRRRCQSIGNAAVVAMALVALAAVFFVAPTERTMGDAQRIVYLHVAVAWVGLAGALVMAAAGAAYLVRRNLRWDHWAQAAAELGWLGSTLTLVTGSLWAHAAWNVWWTWDPRLTTALILWALYSGCLLLRGGVDDPHRRARLGAVLAIAGAADLPLVVMATRWFRGMHPAAPAMQPSMRAVLLASVLGFTALFALLLAMRRKQLELLRLVEELTESEKEMPC